MSLKSLSEEQLVFEDHGGLRNLMARHLLGSPRLVPVELISCTEGGGGLTASGCFAFPVTVGDIWVAVS